MTDPKIKRLISKKNQSDSDMKITHEFSLSRPLDSKLDIQSRLQGLQIGFVSLWLSSGDISEMFLSLDDLEHKIGEFQDYLANTSDDFEAEVAK